MRGEKERSVNISKWERLVASERVKSKRSSIVGEVTERMLNNIVGRRCGVRMWIGLKTYNINAGDSSGSSHMDVHVALGK